MKLMGLTLFQNIIEIATLMLENFGEFWLSCRVWIINNLNLYNEALADPTIFDKISDVKKHLPNAFIKFNSNGDYLTVDVLDKLKQCGLDALFISLHPPMNKPYEDNDRIKAHEKFFKRIGYNKTYHTLIPGTSMRTDLNYGGMRLLIMSDNWYETGTDRSGLVQDNVKVYKIEIHPVGVHFENLSYLVMVMFYRVAKYFLMNLKMKIFLGNVLKTKIWDIYSRESADQWRQDLFTYSPKKITMRSLL